GGVAGVGGRGRPERREERGEGHEPQRARGRKSACGWRKIHHCVADLRRESAPQAFWRCFGGPAAPKHTFLARLVIARGLRRPPCFGYAEVAAPPRPT